MSKHWGYAKHATLVQVQALIKGLFCQKMQIKNLFFSGLEEREATIVGTEQSSVHSWGNVQSLASRLIDGKGLDGDWFNGDGCAATSDDAAPIEWFSLELQVSQKITRVQIANRLDHDEGRGQNIRITIGPSKVYDSNEPLCLPEIPELTKRPGLQDYFCSGDLHEGKFIKISRPGQLNLCEVKIFTVPGSGKSIKY